MIKWWATQPLAHRPVGSEACPECGFRPESIPPPDLEVALRSLPRRFEGRISLIEASVERNGDRPADELPQLLDEVRHCAGHVSATITAFSEALRRVRLHDELDLDTLLSSPAGADDDDTSTSADLADAVDGLASIVEATSLTDWERTATWAGRPVSVLDLARSALHDAIHHLHQIDSRLREAGVDTEPFFD